MIILPTQMFDSIFKYFPLIEYVVRMHSADTESAIFQFSVCFQQFKYELLIHRFLHHQSSLVCNVLDEIIWRFILYSDAIGVINHHFKKIPFLIKLIGTYFLAQTISVLCVFCSISLFMPEMKDKINFLLSVIIIWRINSKLMNLLWKWKVFRWHEFCAEIEKV